MTTPLDAGRYDAFFTPREYNTAPPRPSTSPPNTHPARDSGKGMECLHPAYPSTMTDSVNKTPNICSVCLGMVMLLAFEVDDWAIHYALDPFVSNNLMV